MHRAFGRPCDVSETVFTDKSHVAVAVPTSIYCFRCATWQRWDVSVCFDVTVGAATLCSQQVYIYWIYCEFILSQTCKKHRN